MFELPLSDIAFDEYQELEQLLNLHLQESKNDSWLYHWGATYSMSKAYASLMQSDNPPSSILVDMEKLLLLSEKHI
jgi:hypothetical protein